VLFRIALSVVILNISICPALPHGREPVITLKRTACLGTCPVYSLEIFDDGFIRFVGIDFVQYTGEQRSVVPQEFVENLVADLLKADYFSFQDSYETCKDPMGRTQMITDLPTVVTSLRVGKTKKTVRHYACAPRRLGDLEQEIDRVANSKHWIGNPLRFAVPPPTETPLPSTLTPPQGVNRR
jgi:hypothetical protein